MNGSQSSVAAAPRISRFWLSWDDHFLVIWPTGHAIGKLGDWDGQEPPTQVENELRYLDEGDARCVALVADLDALWAIHERTCAMCQTQQASTDDLSPDGECSLCFIRRMGEEPTQQIPRESLAQCAADWRARFEAAGAARTTACIDEIFAATRKVVSR